MLRTVVPVTDMNGCSDEAASVNQLVGLLQILKFQAQLKTNIEKTRRTYNDPKPECTNDRNFSLIIFEKIVTGSGRRD